MMPRLSNLFAAQPPGIRLQGERVHLRPPDRTDWAAWCELRTVSRDFLAPWEPAWAADALTRAAFRRRIARYAADWRDDEGYAFFIYANGSGALLGGIGLSNIRRGVAETASVGYWIGEPHARRGYMTEAARLASGFGFERLRLHRLEAACLPANEPSRRLLEKIGFRQEGYAKRYLRINGEWQDHLLFGLLREEWQAVKTARTALAESGVA
jgi:ribosomal-protein-alanine N-acetyltransferase